MNMLPNVLLPDTLAPGVSHNFSKEPFYYDYGDDMENQTIDAQEPIEQENIYNKQLQDLINQEKEFNKNLQEILEKMTYGNHRERIDEDRRQANCTESRKHRKDLC